MHVLSEQGAWLRGSTSESGLHARLSVKIGASGRNEVSDGSNEAPTPSHDHDHHHDHSRRMNADTHTVATSVMNATIALAAPTAPAADHCRCRRRRRRHHHHHQEKHASVPKLRAELAKWQGLADGG